MKVLGSLLLLQGASVLVSGFTVPGRNIARSVGTKISTRFPRRSQETQDFSSSSFTIEAASTSSSENVPDATGSGETKKKKKQMGPKTMEELRNEGGPLTFNTPIGALNPFAIYYGLMSIFLGIPWFISLKVCQFMYFVTRGRFDKKRKIPVFLNHLWGVTLMRLSRSFPEMENMAVLKEFYKKGQPAMFVANHNSWMDIPFLGAAVGWRNYKLVSKKELGKIPMLGTAIVAGGNIMIDRKDRRDQLKTLKQGINYLKDGIHLCTFPEGTRSRSGRLLPFKNGAFKMAHKAGAAVIPISIVHSNKVMPHGWMFAMKPSYKVAKVVVHDPVESAGITEQELADEVRRRMITGLPEDQSPAFG